MNQIPEIENYSEKSFLTIQLENNPMYIINEEDRIDFFNNIIEDPIDTNEFTFFKIFQYPDDLKKLDNKEEKKQKPGRKKKNSINIYSQNHSRDNSDNCRVKIKCHFNNFIIDFFNKLIKKKFNKQIYKFRKLPYDISKNVSKKYNKELLNKKIEEILTMEISGKYKNIDPFQNENTFNKSKFLASDFKELLDMKYHEFYQKIYLPDNNRDEIKNKYNLDEDICFHRHSFSSNFIKAGGDPFVLKAMLGHSSINTTSIYIHIGREFNNLKGVKYGEQ